MRSFLKNFIFTLLIFFTTYITYGAWQFIVRDSTVNGSFFESITSSNLTLAPLHAPTNGWDPVSFRDNAIVFTANSSPLAFFDSNEAIFVSRIFIVASLSRISPLATLLDSSIPIRIDIPQGWESSTAFEENNGVLVDGKTIAKPSKSLQLFEEIFDEPISICEIFIGNHPATPTWNRAWQGEIYEIILCDENVNTNQVLSIRSYLAQKWDLLRHSSGLPNEYEILKEMGLRIGNIYKTLMELR